MAAAALTELSNTTNTHNFNNNNNSAYNRCPHEIKNLYCTTQSSSPTPPPPPTSIVTSILNKSYIENLETNSVSVIPIVDNKSNSVNLVTTNNKNVEIVADSSNIVQQKTYNPEQMLSTTTVELPATTCSMEASTLAALASSKHLTQLQQRLETAAVLMDISKKVIISPPNSNPQSPSVTAVATSGSASGGGTVITADSSSIKNSVITSIKRSTSNEEIDLSMKRYRKELIKSPNDSVTPDINRNCEQLTISSTPIKKEVIDHDHDERDDENINEDDRISQNSHSNDDSSDSGRLQMDITSHEPEEYATNTPASKVDELGRETPDSMQSDDHGTDPATTQLWQALAHTTG